MKNYDEMYRRVLRRRDEHLEKKRKHIIIMKRTFPVAAGFCFALILGISLNANKDPFHKPPAVVEEYISPTQPVTDNSNNNNVTQPASPETALPPADTTTSSGIITTIASTTLTPALSGQPENTPPVQTEPAPEISGEITYTTQIQPQTTQPVSAVSRTTHSAASKSTKTSEITKTSSVSKTSDKTTSAKTTVSVSRTTASSTPDVQNRVTTSTVTTPGPGSNNDDPNDVIDPDPPSPSPPPVIIKPTIAYSGYDDLARRLLGESSSAVADQLGTVDQWQSEVFRDFLQKRSDEMTVMIPYFNDEPMQLREETPIILDPSGLFNETWIRYFFPDDNGGYVNITYLHGDEIDPEAYPEYDHSYRTNITLNDRICYAAIGRNNRDPNVYVNFVYDDVLAVMCITENRFTSGFLENFSFRNLQLR